MTRVKKWMLLFCIAGPTVTNLSCSSALFREMREAAISGSANFVELAASTILLDTFGSTFGIEGQ